MLLLLLLVATDPVLRLDWPVASCPSKRALSQALATYGIRVSEASEIAMTARIARDSVVLVLDARGDKTQREVAVPRPCADRAAVLAVVIDALVAPYFWPAGKPRAASRPARSALDFFLPAGLSAKRLDPPSEPASAAADASASAPAALDTASADAFASASFASAALASQPSEPSQAETSSAPVDAPTDARTPSRVPMSVMLLGGFDAAPAEPWRGRVGLLFSVSWHARVRAFAEASFLSLRTLAQAPGQITYGEGDLVVGADVALWRGLFAGAALGLQLVRAAATGFDENSSVWLAGPTSQVRVGYRHTFFAHWELGGQLVLRADVLRQRLLVDQVVVAELVPIHVGFAATAAFTW